MNLLALTTSHKIGSLGLIKNNTLVKLSEWENEKSHAELVTIKIEEALKENNLEVTDLDYFGVDVGPGSFTGIRIAINAIKSLAFVHQQPIITMNSLEIIANSCSAEKNQLGIAINAHSNMCYYSEFNLVDKKLWQTQGVISAVDISFLLKKIKNNDMIFAGDGFGFYSHLIPKNVQFFRPKKYNNFPDAQTFCFLALQRIFEQNLKDLKTWKTLEPLYVRLSAPEEKLDQSSKKN